MEKKIEHVPYISKWYKEELDWSQLFKFDFKDELTSVNWLNKDITTISCPNGITFWSPQKPQLKYVCNLTEEDVHNLHEFIQEIYDILRNFRETGNTFRLIQIENKLDVIDRYLANIDGLRNQYQKEQLDRLIEQSKPKKSYEGTLGEHWKELSELFYIKSNFEHWEKLFNDVIIPDLKLYGYVCPRTEFNIYYYKRANDVYNSLGIEFIEDFVKACEKCED